MNYSRLLELYHEFGTEVESLHTFYFDSLVGYDHIHKSVRLRQGLIREMLGKCQYSSEDYQDLCSVSYQTISGDTFVPVSVQPNMEQGAIKERTRHNGYNSQRLGKLCVASAYTYWEEYLRIEIGKAIGVLCVDAKQSKETKEILRKEVRSDFWADMMYLRHAILHARGVATSDFVKMKYLRWFNPGDAIVLGFDQMREIFLGLWRYRNDLHSMSLRPRKPMIVPSS